MGLDFPESMVSVVSAAGNPVKAMFYSFDCSLIAMNSDMSLQYLRIFW
jgi:hypothetical protein